MHCANPACLVMDFFAVIGNQNRAAKSKNEIIRRRLMPISFSRLIHLILVPMMVGALSPWGILRDAQAGFYVPGQARVSGRPPGTLTNSLGSVFVRIPAGRFLMGSRQGDPDESPPIQQPIVRPFYLARYETTQGEWINLMKTRPWKGQPHVIEGEDYPAVYIDWYQVRHFIQRLNQREHCSCYRLPTEVEWEYAARAGTRSEYSFAGSVARLGEFAWFAGNSGNVRSAHPVGRKKPNPWGLYDIHGNVWEWVRDWDPQDVGPRIRGGSWASPPSSLRSSNRSAWPAEKSGPHIGFRLLRRSP